MGEQPLRIYISRVAMASVGSSHPPTLFRLGAVAPVVRVGKARESAWIAELQFTIHPESIVFEAPDGRRLIKKVSARRADGTHEWTQAFYRSSGRNSRLPKIWFPFLGISEKSGAPYFTKGLAFPASWPAEDRFQKLDRGVPDVDKELVGRFATRSFLLASNALNSLSEDPELRDELAERIFLAVEPESVDSVLQTIISENGAAWPAAWEAATASAATSATAVNAFVGTDVYINRGKAEGARFNLAAAGIPRLMNIEGFVGGARRRKSLRRHRSHSTRRRGFRPKGA